MKQTSYKQWFSVIAACLLLASSAIAQTTNQTLATVKQSAVSQLSTLPESDTVVFISVQRILNEVAPKVMPVADVARMRSAFDDIKKAVGVDPARIDYLAVAIRFRKPTAELSFVSPDLLVVTSGDFSADSLLTMARLYLQDQVHDEKYGSKTLVLMKLDQIAAEAEKNPMLKSYVELGAVALNANTIAFGNTSYLKAAVDAADGSRRISPTEINSLMRNPDALISAAGSPLTSFAKSFGMLGTETTPRDTRCESSFGDFYASVTTDGDKFSLHGAMNADNSDTAKIIGNLLSGLLQGGVGSVPDKNAQSVLKELRLTPKESEVMFEADIAQQAVADFIREQMAPPIPATPKPKSPTKKRVRRRRPVRKSAT